MTPADVQRVAQQYFGAGRVRLLVTPKEQVARCGERRSTARSSRARDAARRFSPPVPQRLTLAGESTCSSSRSARCRLVAAGVYFPGGAVLDPADKPGLSAFMGASADGGHEDTAPASQIAEESDFIAARPNVGVDRENIIISHRGADAALAAGPGAAGRRPRSTRPSPSTRSTACAASV